MSTEISNLTMLRTELDAVRAHMKTTQHADSVYRYVCEVLDRVNLRLWEKFGVEYPGLSTVSPLERIKEWIDSFYAAVQQAWYEEQQAMK